MRIIDIIQLLKEYILLGGVVLLIVGIAFFLGYKIVYQKIMKGEKRISKRKMLWYAITLVYFVIIFGAVFLSRSHSGIYGMPNFHLFSSYWEAYHHMKQSLFRNIILNILLFVPFGFLLPHNWERCQKGYRTILIGFCVSMCIELVQYITKIGICELDDIFNNTLGVWIGYGIYKTVYNLKHREKRVYILIYLLPVFLSIITFASIYGIYQGQEFGNLEIEANYRLNVKQAKMETEVELEKNTSIQPIYSGKIVTEAETRKKAEEIFAKLGTEISPEDTDIYEETAIYYATDRAYSIWMDYQGGRYTFTDFSIYGKDKETMQLQKDATREEVVQALAKLGVEVPDTAEFREEERQYVFTVTMQEVGENLMDGTIWAIYYKDGTVRKMNYNLVTYEKVIEKEIKSEWEAWEEIQKGKFQYVGKQGEKIQSLIVQAVELKYQMDTKGYFVPYYEFTAQINGEEVKIAVKALR